jgi:signal transduction histidine kinase
MRTIIRWLKPNPAAQGFWLGTVLSLGIGLGLYQVTEAVIEKDAHNRFLSTARTAQSNLHGRIKSYVDVLRGASSLFQTASNLNREQFHRYVEGLNLETEFPGIEAVNFAHYFKDEDRPAFEEDIRAQLAEVNIGYPAQFRIFPPGRRPDYTVLTYIEPISVWSVRLGVDLQTRPSVAAALAESRDTELPTASGTLVRLRTTPIGLGMRLPVYRAGAPHRTAKERRAAYIGTVGIGFSVERLVKGVLDDLPAKALRIVISGMSPDEEFGGPRGVYRRVVMFDNMPSRPAPGTDTESFDIVLPIGNSGRGWDVHFSVKKSAMYSGLDAYVPWLAMFAGGGGAALLYALFHALSSSRKRAMELATEMTRELRASEAKLKNTNETLRRLAAHAENIKEGERKRIAREIHDDLGQNLLALRIEADLLSSRTGDRHPRLHARAQWTLEQIDATIKSVRQIINDLRPNVLDLGLSAAVDWQISQFRRLTGIACELLENTSDVHVNDRCATALFRILQESLNNISRHAHATEVRVELHVGSEWISMTVSDNGVGLPAAGRHKPGSFGLVGIEERVKILGGVFAFASAEGSGTTVRVALPVGDVVTATGPEGEADEAEQTQTPAIA